MQDKGQGKLGFLWVMGGGEGVFWGVGGGSTGVGRGWGGGGVVESWVLRGGGCDSGIDERAVEALSSITAGGGRATFRRWHILGQRSGAGGGGWGFVAGVLAGDDPVAAHEVPDDGEEANGLSEGDGLFGGGGSALDEEVEEYPIHQSEALG